MPANEPSVEFWPTQTTQSPHANRAIFARMHAFPSKQEKQKRQPIATAFYRSSFENFATLPTTKTRELVSTFLSFKTVLSFLFLKLFTIYLTNLFFTYILIIVQLDLFLKSIILINKTFKPQLSYSLTIFKVIFKFASYCFFLLFFNQMFLN